MPIWVLLVVALLGVSGSGWADVVPQRKWLQVRSPHFTVMGEAGARWPAICGWSRNGWSSSTPPSAR